MKFRNLRWCARRQAPTRAQLKALEENREHRIAVMNTHPQLIRAPKPSRGAPYGADEFNEDDSYE